jgi:hypothetical protein
MTQARALATAALVFLFSLNCRADFYLHHWDDYHASDHELNMDLDLTSYNAPNDFGPTGESFNPAGLSEYSRIETDLTGFYGLSPSLTGYGRLTWGRVNIESSTTPGTVFGPLDQTIGFNWRLYEQYKPTLAPGITVELQLQADLPPYSNTAANTNSQPFLGDGTMDITAGGFLTYPVSLGSSSSPILFRGGVGYTYRTSGFSSAVPWSILASYTPRYDGFLFEAAFMGLTSLVNDARTSSASPTVAINDSATAGGSFLVNAINPSLFVLRERIGYQLGGTLAFVATAEESIWGEDAPSGLALSFGIRFSLGGNRLANHDPAKMSPKDYGHSNQGFISYSLDAKVLRASDRLNLVKIDKGSLDGVNVGQIFDIFSVQQNGSAAGAVARGKVTHANTNEAALTITEYFKENFIDEGFVAKRLVQ